MKKLFFSLPILVIFLTACSTPGPIEPESPITVPTPTPLAEDPAEPLPTEVLPTDPPADTPEPTLEPTPEPAPAVDALQVAFVNADQNMLLWNEDTGLVELAAMSGVLDVQLSEDGTMVAFVKEISISEHELWVVNADGSNLRVVMEVDDFRALDPAALGVIPYQFAWIPGTHTIAFNTMQYIEGPGLFLYDDLYFLDVDANDLTIQLSTGSGGNFYFSPDGQQYAVVKPESISLLNTDGSNIREDVLTYPYVLTFSEYQYYAEPVWSPDSTFLRVAIPPQDALGEPEAFTILWELPTDGSLAQQIGEIVTQPFFVDPVHYSPDLNHIAYTRLPTPEDFLSAELVIADADGSNEAVYATGNVYFLGWNPDSQTFAFELSDVEETYWHRIGSDSPTRMAEFPSIWDVTWMDATRFLFTTPGASGWQLYLGTLGQPSVLLADLPDGAPVFDFDR